VFDSESANVPSGLNRNGLNYCLPPDNDFVDVGGKVIAYALEGSHLESTNMTPTKLMQITKAA
jgi:hypothetical protein